MRLGVDADGLSVSATAWRAEPKARAHDVEMTRVRKSAGLLVVSPMLLNQLRYAGIRIRPVLSQSRPKISLLKQDCNEFLQREVKRQKLQFFILVLTQDQPVGYHTFTFC